MPGAFVPCFVVLIDFALFLLILPFRDGADPAGVVVALVTGGLTVFDRAFVHGPVHAHARPRRDRLRDEGITTDDGALADHGVAAQNRCPGIDGHIILEGRVPPASA